MTHRQVSGILTSMTNTTQENEMRKSYVAIYPLNESGNDLDEQIVMQDSYWSAKLNAEFDRLTIARNPKSPMVQGWYSDNQQVVCMATTNQPFQLD